MIVKTVVLACEPDRAFELFTAHATAWWPPERRHTRDPASAITMVATGRFFERATDGREVELGRVRAWQPPARLELDWYPGTDAAHPTRVVVTFRPVAGGTEVRVEHSPTDASAELWHDRAPRYATSWDLVLAAVAAYATGGLARR